jgi:hypothetical protein
VRNLIIQILVIVIASIIVILVGITNIWAFIFGGLLGAILHEFFPCVIKFPTSHTPDSEDQSRS